MLLPRLYSGAIQAGKHVSVEKPCCHNIFEGQKLVEAARKYDVIVQDGAEQRSNPCAISMADYLHHGGIGEVYMAKGLCYKWRNNIGNLFYGSEGYMSKHLDGWFSFMGDEHEEGESGEGIGNHFENFCNAIRANDQSLAMADIEEGFYSCALIHLGNISYRLGRTLEFDPGTMKFINDNEANALLTRKYRAPFVVPDRV